MNIKREDIAVGATVSNTKKTARDDKKQNYQRSTTNYRMDGHKEFCKRCFAYNKGCPHPRGMRDCNL